MRSADLEDEDTVDDVDEVESAVALVRQAPALLQGVRLQAMRILYAAEPVLAARKSIVELISWRSKPSSAVALLLIVYIGFYQLFLPASLFVAAYYILNRWIAALRARSTKPYLRSDEFAKRDDFFAAVIDVKVCMCLLRWRGASSSPLASS